MAPSPSSTRSRSACEQGRPAHALPVLLFERRRLAGEAAPDGTRTDRASQRAAQGLRRRSRRARVASRREPRAASAAGRARPRGRSSIGPSAARSLRRRAAEQRHQPVLIAESRSRPQPGRERRQQRLPLARGRRHSSPDARARALRSPPPRSGRGSTPRPAGPRPRARLHLRRDFPSRAHRQHEDSVAVRRTKRVGETLHCAARCRRRAARWPPTRRSTSTRRVAANGLPCWAYQARAAIRARAELALQLATARHPEKPQQLALGDGRRELRGLRPMRARRMAPRHPPIVAAAPVARRARCSASGHAMRYRVGHEAHARRPSRCSPAGRRRASRGCRRLQARKLRARRQAIRGNRPGRCCGDRPSCGGRRVVSGKAARARRPT